jgi:DNA-binding NtrC family response regulator
MAKILLVDDDVDLTEGYAAVLTARGHEVKAVHSAADARALVDAGETPDVFVLDVMMESDTAGFALAREIHEKLPDVPAVMLSGVREASGAPYRFEPDETWLPVIKFFDKPLEPARLAAEIEALVS